MKQDELSARLAAGVGFYQTHRNRIALAAIVAMAAVAVGLGLYFYIRNQQNLAGAAFSKALNTYHAPVLAAPPAIPNLESYKTNEEKNAAALAAFNSVAQEYSYYSAGKLARYYAAICHRELGNYEEAERAFQAQSQSGDERLASLARLGLASIYETTDRSAEAEAIYKELQEGPTEAIPVVTALVARADLYRQTNPPEALILYQQIVQDYRGTPAGDYAEMMLSQLPQWHREGLISGWYPRPSEPYQAQSCGNSLHHRSGVEDGATPRRGTLIGASTSAIATAWFIRGHFVAWKARLRYSRHDFPTTSETGSRTPSKCRRSPAPSPDSWD
jgi:tetratricopeptide (TPR) repeat protein